MFNSFACNAKEKMYIIAINASRSVWSLAILDIHSALIQQAKQQKIVQFVHKNTHNINLAKNASFMFVKAVSIKANLRLNCLALYPRWQSNDYFILLITSTIFN